MRLIDADALLKWYCGGCNGTDLVGCGDPCIEYKGILNAPTIDAVEVVRCKDCIAFGKSPYGHPGLGWCRIYGHHFKPDYYCASGKREVNINGS